MGIACDISLVDVCPPRPKLTLHPRYRLTNMGRRLTYDLQFIQNKDALMTALMR
jgi:hypothetical protein